MAPHTAILNLAFQSTPGINIRSPEVEDSCFRIENLVVCFPELLYHPYVRVQLFVPITVVCLCVIMPVHLNGDDLDRQYENITARVEGGQEESLRGGLKSRLMRSTVANIREFSRTLWWAAGASLTPA